MSRHEIRSTRGIKNLWRRSGDGRSLRAWAKWQAGGADNVARACQAWLLRK